MDKQRVCSLFSGIGGIEEGVISALGKENVEVVFASELDKITKRAYEYIHDTEIAGDITKVNKEEIPDHDILVGGFPCQAFSIAGKMEGFNDTRGTLFFQIEKIMEVKKPRIVFLENVKNLISHDKGRTLEVILEKISEQGYQVDFEVLNSKHFDAPQSRERIYIVAKRIERQEEIESDWEIKKKNNTLNKRKKMLNQNKKIKKMNFPFPEEKEEKIMPMTSILEKEVDEKYFFNDEKKEDLLKELKGQNLTSLHTTKNHLNMVGELNIKGNDSIRRVYHPYGVCPTLTTMGGGHREPKIIVQKEDGELDVRKLTPLECLRVQRFPDEYYEKMKELNMSNSRIYKAAGNAVTVSTIKNIFLQIKKEML